MKYIFGYFKAIHFYKATKPTLFSQNCSTIDHRSKCSGISLHFLVLSLLFLSGFLMSSLATRANWWNATNGEPYAVKDRFKVSFDNTSGRFTIRAFAIDMGYFPHSTLATTYAKLSYTTDGYNYVPFFEFSYNPHWQDTPNESGFVYVHSLDSHATDGGQNSGDRIIHLNIFNGIRDIKGIKIECTLMNSDGDDRQDGNSAVINYEIPKVTFHINGYNYLEDNRVKIDWNSKWSPANELLLANSHTSQFDGAGNKIADLGQGLSGGSFYVNQSNQSQKYYLVHYTYSGKITDTASIVVPAFTHPSAISAVYNPATQKVDINWTIPAASGDSVQKYPFKLQRATKPDFSDATDISISSYESTKYYPDSTSYTYSESPYANVYYRVARNVNQDWGWELGKSVQSTLIHAAFTITSQVVLSLDNSRLLATLKWQPSGVWTKGAQFIISRINKTTGISNSFQLGMEDYFNGTFTDSLIRPCNEYYYTLQIKPADNLGFVAEKAFQSLNSITPYTIGTIRNITASKGYFPDRVELSWDTEGAFDNYIVKRKVYGSADNFIQIANVPSSPSVNLQAEDSKGMPGVYYQYMILGAVNCNDVLKYSKDTLYAIGFRAPTGNIYGRVTYEGGQSVQDVAVRLQSDENTKLGQSIYLNGTDSSYLEINSLHTSFEDSAFTVEAWIKPDNISPENEVIFSKGTQYELGFDANGKLYFTYNGKTVTGDYVNENQSYIHVSGIHSRDSISIMVNESVIASVRNSFSPSDNAEIAVYIGRNTTGNSFKGYIDEMSVWNTALNKKQIARDYTRLLTGGEPGLAAYWRFDETITNQFYDISHFNEKYNQNDGIMSATYVKRSNIIPSEDQLSLKAYTDTTGNYLIAGIPYTGSGTTYTVVPLFETHQFEPTLVNRLVSAGSNSFTVDFTDKSAFAVSGYVYYRNSTVPVTDVQFKIDGLYAQEGNGNIIATDATGKFTFSVPIGIHKVQAVKNNHVFVNDGKITDRFGNDLNYQGPISQRTLYDSTTIRFIGRVAGGSLQESYPLGHSLSTNNLGKALSINMALPSGTKYNLYAGTSPDSTVIIDHLLPSGTKDSSKIHYSRVVYSANKIMIYPDSATGEFAADLIPEKFIASNVQATGWGDLLDGQSQSLDFSNKFVKVSSVYDHVDSSQSNLGRWSYIDYSDSVVYNDSYQFIKRVLPAVTISQVSNGRILNYLGDSLYNSQSLAGKKETVALLNTGKIGEEMYLFGHPVFTQGVTYHFQLKAFEEYPFYESVMPDGAPVPLQKDGKAVVDQVPTQDGDVSINNGIQNSAGPDALSLDSTGVAYYDFIGGDPNIISGLKDFSATVRFGQAADVSWKWFGSDPMKAFVIGSHQTGTDFVTAGPDRMLMVLRDPPGSRSYSFAENGSTITSSATYSGSVDNETDVTNITSLGLKNITWTGFGAGVIVESDATNDDGQKTHFESHYTNSNTKETTVTLSSRFQTGDDPLFVGAPADLFVGYSTNITYGKSNNLTIIDRDNLQATDKVILDPGPASPYLVVERDGINFGEKFGTLFAYPQQHIETVLIPNLKRIRNTILLPRGTSPASAQEAANTQKTAVYVSKLTNDNPNFGKSNNDSSAFGSAAKTQPFNNGPSYTIYFPSSSDYRTDTIMILNQYVQKWEQELAKNEKQKLTSTLLQNYSFHAGSPIDYSEQTSSKGTETNTFDIIIAAHVFVEAGVEVLGTGLSIKTEITEGTTQGGVFENSSENSSTIGFQLAADGVGEYISVDAGKATDGSFTFRTKGGETECPYEGGSVTKYYQPGTLLDQPTSQMDKPQITIDRSVVNNVPATQSASYTLHLENASEAEWSTAFVLDYGNTDSIQGAILAVDGLSIANGRNIPVIYGQTVNKVLTLTKGPDAMDYNNIPIILHSACQYDITGYQQLIADTVFISAHFVPSCSNINVKSPTDHWVLNTESAVNEQGKRYLPVTLDQFDESNSLFHHIELQYKSSNNSQWITAMSFYGDSTIYKAASGEKAFITNAQGINYTLEMDDASYNDQMYDIRGVAYCELSPGNLINTPSNVISGIKDTYNPRLFGSPEPGNGILGVGDDIRLNFNETIAAGLLTPSDFRVTGIRNGAQGDHSVSVDLDGVSNYLFTEFDKNLSGRNITTAMWVLPDNIKEGTLFSQGNINESMELGFTADNHMKVIVGKKKITSDSPLEYHQGNWAHAVLVYDAEDSTVSAFYNFKEVIHKVSVSSYNGVGPFELGRSISKEGDFFAGKMHGVQIWTQDLSSIQLQINSLTRLSGAEDGLLGYYPLTEGKGNIAFDEAHANNATLVGNWSTPAGKSLEMNGTGYLKIATGVSPITSGMDYTIGLWFKGEPGQTDAALASNGKGDGSDPAGGSKKSFSLGFENGLLTFVNNGFKVQADGNYLDNNWHHVAIAVNRTSATGQLFVDGILKKYFNTQALGGIAAAYTYLGARAWFDSTDLVNPHFDRNFKGEVDEFRIWNTYLNEAFITANSNTRLKGDELGLMVYYPFEKYFEFQNNKEMGFTLSDMKLQEDPKVKVPDATAVNVIESNDMAPIKDRGPVDNLNFDFVVNNDALIINMLEPRQAIDKTIVTFQAKNVQDVNGNSLVSPITWTAYIDQNPLKWSDDELNLSRDVYKPLQFESYIINSGGSIQHFVIDNLPRWLTADITDGTVDPSGKQKITFTVNEGLNVGSYDEVIYMRNDNGESQALTINVKVNGKTPDWKVNPEDFQYNMTVYGKIRVQNIFSDDKEDMLAAFVNGKCVGVVHNAYLEKKDLWYVFLTVYSNSLSLTDNIEFRLWDASAGKIYQAIPSTPGIKFLNDAVIGTSDNPVIFDGREMTFENFNLNKGWNWISFNLYNPNLSSVNATLLYNGIWTPGDEVKNNEVGAFDQYSESIAWKGSLTKSGGFNNRSLYMLNTATAQIVSVNGTRNTIDTTHIPVNGNRWNYISYLPQVNMTVEEALADYAASDQDVIKSQTGFTMYSSQNGWVGNLTYLEPGKGYMLFRKENTNTKFVYPVNKGSLNIERAMGGQSGNLNKLQTPVTSNFKYAENMTVVLEVKGFSLLPNDRILAYAGDELRGEAIPLQNPLTKANTFFFNIPGSVQEPVGFRVERAGNVIAQADSVINYKPNSMMGTLQQPFILKFAGSAIAVNISPNPFHKEVMVKAELPAGNHEVQMSVYSITGQLMVAYSKEIITGSYYQKVWNGRNSSGMESGAGVYFIHLVVDGKTHVYKVIKL